MFKQTGGAMYMSRGGAFVAASAAPRSMAPTAISFVNESEPLLAAALPVPAPVTAVRSVKEIAADIVNAHRDDLFVLGVLRDELRAITRPSFRTSRSGAVIMGKIDELKDEIGIKGDAVLSNNQHALDLLAALEAFLQNRSTWEDLQAVALMVTGAPSKGPSPSRRSGPFWKA